MASLGRFLIADSLPAFASSCKSVLPRLPHANLHVTVPWDQGGCFLRRPLWLNSTPSLLLPLRSEIPHSSASYVSNDGGTAHTAPLLCPCMHAQDAPHPQVGRGPVRRRTPAAVRCPAAGQGGEGHTDFLRGRSVRGGVDMMIHSACSLHAALAAASCRGLR